MRIILRIFAALAPIIAMVFIFSCNAAKKEGWSEEERNEFRTTCVENSKAALGEDTSKRYCECMLGKIEAKYPNSEKAGNMPISETMQLAKECLK